MTKAMASRSLASLALAALAWLLLAAAGKPSSTSILEPNKLIIISTVDVKGETGPCG